MQPCRLSEVGSLTLAPIGLALEQVMQPCRLSEVGPLTLAEGSRSSATGAAPHHGCMKNSAA